ncbi:MAG TPA: MFS transporter [Thermoplasmataceae archaeon]|nr:MFS transporter [Thermoplasmataceae archaeon]
MPTAISGLERKNLIYFNLAKVSALSAFGPFEIYALFLLSSTTETRLILGSIMVGALAIQVALTPQMGSLIDSTSRKKFSATIMLVWLSTALLISFLLSVFSEAKAILVSALFLLLDVTGGFFFDGMRGLQQTITGTQRLGMSNGLAEMSGQLPNIVGPALAILFIPLIGVGSSLIISAAICLVGIFSLGKVFEGYKPAKSKPSRERNAGNGTISYMKNNPGPIFYVFMLNFPFIMVTAGNLIKPVFIVTALHGGTFQISLSELAYAAFASLTGAVLSMVLKKHELFLAYSFFALYTLGTFLMPLSPNFITYLAVQSTHGIGNPGTRICRNTFVMKRVDRRYSGRFFGSVSFLSTLTRIALLVTFTASINILGPRILFVFSGVVLLAALLGSLLFLRDGRTREFVHQNQPDDTARGS